eukprot:gene688-3988_t
MGVIVRLLQEFGSLLRKNDAIVHEFNAVTSEITAIVSVIAQSRLVLWSTVAALLYLIYWILFSKLFYLRRNHDVRRRRLRGDLPPVYPNGWFQMCAAHDLRPGGVISDLTCKLVLLEAKQVHILGKEFAVFRTQSGKVACLDAYCPHLGANLAAGGIVVGETIHCPFHGWVFDCEGRCKDIPYASSKIPEQANTKSHPVLEMNGQILFWFDAEGRNPTWYPPELPKVNKEWSWRGTSRHYLNCHIQEVPENAADVAHLHYLHGPGLLAGTDLRKTHSTSMLDFVKHNWYASWEPVDEPGKKHLSVLKLVHRLSLLGWELPMLDLNVTATQVGPGLVYLEWSSFFGTGVFVQALTPKEPLYQELTHAIYASSSVPQIVAKFYLFGEAKQVERDVMVWNNKMYRKAPVLVKEDKLIAQHQSRTRCSTSESTIGSAANADTDMLCIRISRRTYYPRLLLTLWWKVERT